MKEDRNASTVHSLRDSTLSTSLLRNIFQYCIEEGSGEESDTVCTCHQE